MPPPQRKAMDKTRRCSQCRRMKAEAEFWPGRKRKGIRVRLCMDCAAENMAKWSRTHNVGMTDKDIQAID